MIATASYIGETARTTGASVKAIRFYERTGLLPRAERSAGNFRLFSHEDVERIRFIRRARTLGFALSEVRQILDCHDGGRSPCNRVRETIEEKVQAIDRKLEELGAARKGLLSMRARFAARPAAAAAAVCPVIQETPA